MGAHTANSKFLSENKSPLRKTGERDNRGSHFYLALYWAEALAGQTEHSEISSIFKPVHEQLLANESVIMNELNSEQGKHIDIGGYYHPDANKVSAAMRPSKTFNTILSMLHETIKS